MQRDEVFYSHSNLLFQQFTGCYIGFLASYKRPPEASLWALHSSLTSLQRTKHKAMKSGRKKTTTYTNKKQNQGTWNVPVLRVTHRTLRSRCRFLYLDTEAPEETLADESLPRSIIHSTNMVVHPSVNMGLLEEIWGRAHREKRDTVLHARGRQPWEETRQILKAHVLCTLHSTEQNFGVTEGNIETRWTKLFLG